MNRIAFLFICILFLLNIQIGRAQEIKLPSNEVFVSANFSRSSIPGKGKMGIGLGYHHLFFLAKRINLITGLEYNYFNFYILVLSAGSGSHSRRYDNTFHVNRILLPLLGRINLNKTRSLFIDLGAFVDFDINSKVEREDNYYPPEGGVPEGTTFEDANLRNGYGGSFGFGYATPVKQNRLSFLLEYKQGFNDVYDFHDDFKFHLIRINIGFVF